MRRLCIPILLAFLISAWPGYGADSTSARSAPVDYIVGPGDVISIGVYGLTDFDQIVRISNSGRAHIRHLGVVQIAGMTVPDLESGVAQQIHDRGLVKEPWVQVRVLEYRAQPVYVLGEVMMPGQFVIEDEMYINDLVVLSMGFNAVASPVGYLYRRNQDQAANTDPPVSVESAMDEVIPINFKELSEGRNPEMNLRLRGGDVLYVPEIVQQRFYVVGDVLRAGHFIIPPHGQLLASRALSMAGGPGKTAKLSKAVLVRFGEDGGRTEVNVNFKALLSGKQPDLVVEPNDIIFVPGSVAKTLAYGMLGMLPNLAAEAATRP